MGSGKFCHAFLLAALLAAFLLAALLAADHAGAQSFDRELQAETENDTSSDLAENDTTTSTTVGSAELFQPKQEKSGTSDTVLIIIAVIGGLIGTGLIILVVWAFMQGRAGRLHLHRLDIRNLDAGVAGFEEHLRIFEKQVDNFEHHAGEDKEHAAMHSELIAKFRERFAKFKTESRAFLQQQYEPELKKRKDAKEARERERRRKKAAEQERQKAQERKALATQRKKLQAKEKALRGKIEKQQQPHQSMKDELLATEAQLRALAEVDEEAAADTSPLVHSSTSYHHRLDEDDDADGCCGGASPITSHREITHQLEELRKLRANLDVVHGDFKSMREKVFPDGLPGAEDLHLVMPGIVHESSPGKCHGRGGGKFGGYLDDQVKLLNTFNHPLLEGVQVKPFGVLGSRDHEKDPQPLTPIDAVVVDPAGWNYVGRSNNCRGAGGASKSVYQWLNLTHPPRMGRFPQEVSRHFSTSLEKEAETRAKLFCYGQGQVVIHTIGPKLRDLQPGVQSLALTYLNVFSEFCQALISSSTQAAPGNPAINPDQPGNAKVAGIPSTLRLCPISSGIFCENARLQPHMAEITWAALSLAMAMLPANLQAVLRKATIEVCVFQASDLPTFEQGLKQRKAQMPLKLGQELGRIAARESGWEGPSFDWVRKQNGPEDRLERLSAFLQTAQAVASGGYALPDGRQAKLDLAEMLSRTCVLSSEGSPAGATEAPTASAGEEDRAEKNPSAVCSSPLPQVVMDKGGLTVLEVATQIQRTGRSVAAVNAASAYSVGGGVLSGGRHALEESCCITSTLLPSLQQIHWDGLQAMQQAKTVKTPGSRWHPPAPEETPHMHVPVDGCIVSPAVEVFREASTKGYKFFDAPVRLAGVCSVAMFNMNPRVSDSPCDAPRDFQTYCDQVKQKFRSVVAGAIQLGAEVLVCPDVGCGVFANDPKVLGMLFGEVLKEPAGTKLKEVVLTGQVAFSETVKRVCAGQKVDVPTPAYFASVYGCSGAGWHAGPRGHHHGGGGRGGTGRHHHAGRGHQHQAHQPTVVVATTALAVDTCHVDPSAEDQHQPLAAGRAQSPMPMHDPAAEVRPPPAAAADGTVM